jgi:hypothetical protein
MTKTKQKLNKNNMTQKQKKTIKLPKRRPQFYKEEKKEE